MADKNALLGFCGEASISIPFVGAATAGKKVGNSKSTIRMAGVADPFKR